MKRYSGFKLNTIIQSSKPDGKFACTIIYIVITKPSHNQYLLNRIGPKFQKVIKAEADVKTSILN